ncbi:cytochrome c oxidase subunit II [Rossellomorea oryzaecorticis]|jgi:cytochrome c oxidase subunit II|uniref:Cytochrome aa3 subunit 2 n=1 Tax=Rossellomorea oryzaecorticis TaxID=1396505 RepID=A0ABW8VR77_9BACI|nr:cytochrome c oxidase subunit II [[Bacillus] enclensis]MBH9967702.1 cytochrome c oxidase subunit II [[Bacillus] enclensis]OAT83973.1 cytochrome B5 [Bacillus sp. MKU004]QTC43267.1 cytochrome c oxidase subunit II [Bacillus sp. V3]
MHMHRYEKWWLTLGTGSLIIFLIILGISAFHQGHQPPSAKAYINPEQVDVIAPFDKPGLKKVEGKEWDYELVLVASTFLYNPGEVEVPKGSRLKIIATTKDVIHGFEVAGTNINMMLEPGYISEYTTTLDKTGEFLVVCNEYCGVGHHTMKSMIKVVD